MTVFVCHSDGRLDLTDARRFGELRILFRREVFPDEVDEQAPMLLSRARHMLANFDPEQDYLALVGSPLHIALCAFVLGRHPRLRVLRFDRMGQAYYEVDLAPEVTPEVATAVA